MHAYRYPPYKYVFTKLVTFAVKEIPFDIFAEIICYNVPMQRMCKGYHPGLFLLIWTSFLPFVRSS